MILLCFMAFVMKWPNTHDWNYDKPYEWGLETLTETTFIKNL